MLEHLRSRFVPVAVDQHIHRHLKDEEGKIFASLLTQAKRGLDGYSQGVYLFTPGGKLLEFANTAEAGHVRRMLASALRKFDPAAETGEAEKTPRARRPVPGPPEGGLVVAVTSKVLGGYENLDARRARIHAESLGRDYLWLRHDESERLAAGVLPSSVSRRIARFHLVDNTRGEPPFWRDDEIRTLDLSLKDGRLTGTVRLETASGDRGYAAELSGVLETRAGRVTRFDLVASGDYWGGGAFTGGGPRGKFPFAVAFRLIEPKMEPDRALPGAARGSLNRYLQ